MLKRTVILVVLAGLIPVVPSYASGTVTVGLEVIGLNGQVELSLNDQFSILSQVGAYLPIPGFRLASEGCMASPALRIEAGTRLYRPRPQTSSNQTESEDVRFYTSIFSQMTVGFTKQEWTCERYLGQFDTWATITATLNVYTMNFGIGIKQVWHNGFVRDVAVGIEAALVEGYSGTRYVSTAGFGIFIRGGLGAKF